MKMSLFILFSVIVTVSVVAEPDPNWVAFRPGLADDAEPAFRHVALDNGGTLTVMPTHQFYPVYLADPRRPQFQYVFLRENKPDIPEAGDRRSLDSAGIERSLLRYQHPSDWAIELSGNAGITAQFDFDHSLDAVGFDGWYGGAVSGTQGDWGVKLSVGHQSSHLGDEYVQRTERERIRYTREDIGLGVSWWGHAHWRFYVEGAHAFTRNADFQEPWEIVYGAEYTGEPTLLWNSCAWYAAAHLRHMEERDWELNTSVQAGLLWLAGGSQRIRTGVQYYDGQSNMGEFSELDESYLAFGFWLDL